MTSSKEEGCGAIWSSITSELAAVGVEGELVSCAVGLETSECMKEGLLGVSRLFGCLIETERWRNTVS